MTKIEKESKQAKRALDEAIKRNADKDADYKKLPEEKEPTSKMMPLGPKGGNGVSRPADYDAGFKVLRKWVDENGWGSCGTDVGKKRARQLALLPYTDSHRI